MSRFLIIFGLVFASCSGASCHPRLKAVTPIAPELYSAVILIHGQTASGAAMVGTGFFISDDTFVTAAHVAQVMANPVAVRLRLGYHRGRGILELVDLDRFRFTAATEFDAAIITLAEPAPPHKTIRMCTDLPGPGQRVRAIGFPDGKLSESRGVVISDYPPGRTAYHMRVIPGYSGGPIEFLGHNCAAAVTWASLGAGPGAYTLGVDATLISQLLAQHFAP